MKKYLKLLLLLAMSMVCHKVHSQELEEIVKGLFIQNMRYINDQEFIGISFENGHDVAYKISDEGIILANCALPVSNLVECPRSVDGEYTLFSLTVSGDTTFFHKATMKNDLSVTNNGVIWYEAAPITDCLKSFHVCYTADRSTILSYMLEGNTPDDCKTKVVKIGADGNLVGERVFPNCARAC